MFLGKYFFCYWKYLTLTNISVIHTLLILFQATVLNVAFNSHNKALLTIMMSNNVSVINLYTYHLVLFTCILWKYRILIIRYNPSDILYVICMRYKIYCNWLYFRYIVSLECGKTLMTSLSIDTKSDWRILPTNI